MSPPHQSCWSGLAGTGVGLYALDLAVLSGSVSICGLSVAVERDILMHWTGSMRSPRLCEARWRWLNSSVQNNTTSPLLPGGEQELLVLPAPVFHSPIAADPEPMSRFMLPGVLSARAHAPCLTQPRVGHGPEVDSHAVWHTLSPSQPPPNSSSSRRPTQSLCRC